MFIDDLWSAINIDAITDHQSTHELLISVDLLSIAEVLLMSGDLRANRLSMKVVCRAIDSSV
jgi:hypothetical protein